MQKIDYDYAVHSDFLIHWTGKLGDIDENDDGHEKSDKSETTETEMNKYLERLRDILKYGFWMTEDPESYSELQVEKVPQVCFTQMKISESRPHAKKYGRLGIGVKRPFLFERGGRPVIYYGFGSNGLPIRDAFFDLCKEKFIGNEEKMLLNFFKPMNKTKPLNYDLFSESEWKITANKNGNLHEDSIHKAKRLSKSSAYYKSLSDKQRDKCKFLLPITSWLGIIIYPSLDVKIKAQADPEIRKLIKKITFPKKKYVESGSWPIEVTLDACRNF